MQNMNRIIIAHLNINFLRNKFENLQEQINGNMNILLISETKLDNSFPNRQFLIKGYSAPYRLDRDAQGGEVLLFMTYSTSDNEIPPISRVLIGRHLIFDSLTSPPGCNSPRKCTPVKYKKRQKAGFPVVT